VIQELDDFQQRKEGLDKDRIAQISTWLAEQKTCLERAAELREAIKALGGNVGRKGRPAVKGAAKSKGGRPPGSRNKPKASPAGEGGGPVEVS